MKSSTMGLLIVGAGVAAYAYSKSKGKSGGSSAVRAAMRDTPTQSAPRAFVISYPDGTKKVDYTPAGYDYKASANQYGGRFVGPLAPGESLDENGKLVISSGGRNAEQAQQLNGYGGRLRGLGAVGEAQSAGVRFKANAVVAPQFNRNQPGTYRIGFMVEAVPLAEAKDVYLSADEWTTYIRNQGIDATVTRVEYGGSTDPRSTGGPLDIFGTGEAISDQHYIVTVVFPPADSGMNGLGVVDKAAVGLAVGLSMLAAFIYYKLTGRNVVVEFVQFAGAALGAGVRAITQPVVEGATSVLVPILVIGGAALFILNKTGTKVSLPGFSTRGG